MCACDCILEISIHDAERSEWSNDFCDVSCHGKVGETRDKKAHVEKRSDRKDSCRTELVRSGKRIVRVSAPCNIASLNNN